METLVALAGIVQLVITASGLAVPVVLKWKSETAKLEPLTRKVFWTYAAYISATNLAASLLSILRPGWLLDSSPLALAVSAYLALYWGARLVIQVVWYRRDAPRGSIYRLADQGFTAAFLCLAAVYTAATLAR